MWLMTDSGFISVVAFDTKKDKVPRSNRQIKSWGKYPVLVRARIEGDLEQLRPYWGKLRIEKDKSADYHYRAIMPRLRFIDFMMNVGWNIDYDSHFKEVAQARSPGGSAEGSRRHSAYMKVWSDLAGLQPERPYYGYSGGGYSDYSKSGTGWSGSSSSSHTSGNSGNSATTSDDYSTRCNHNYLSSLSTGRYRVYCSLKVGHSGGHLMDEKYEVSSSGDANFQKPIKAGTTKADTNPLSLDSVPPRTHARQTTTAILPTDMADTVEEMCTALTKKTTDQIKTDEGTPYPVYDLWAQANNEYPKDTLTALQLLDILEELVEEQSVTEAAKNLYKAAIDKLMHGQVSEIDPFDLSEEDLAHYAGLTAGAKEILAPVSLDLGD